MRSNSASVTVSSDWFLCVIPALLTRISSPPKRLTAAAIMRSASTFCETSAVTSAAASPIRSATLAAFSVSMTAMRTLAPSRAKASAMPRPKPDAPPVTIATLPSRRIAKLLTGRLPTRRSPRDFGAVGARGVGAEHLELGREERQLLERERHRPVRGMALDVGVEHGGVEAALGLVALELGHVDAVGGKAAQGLVERGRHVLDAEDEGRDHRPMAGVGVVGVLGKDQEARGVVRLVLDVAHQDLEAVDLGREPRGDGRERRIFRLSDNARGARGVGFRHRREAELAQHLAALSERMRMAQNLPHRLQRPAFLRHQLMAHAQEVLADDIEVGIG